MCENNGWSTILFQIGLDGIRMLDPSTSRTLRIYPLETITRCEVSLNFILIFYCYCEFWLEVSIALFFFSFSYRKRIHLPLHFGQRALLTLIQDVLDCSQIVTLQAPFWIQWLLQLYRFGFLCFFNNNGSLLWFTTCTCVLVDAFLVLHLTYVLCIKYIHG